MPEHVHLLLNEPALATLGDAIHDLKLSFCCRLKYLSPATGSGGFWEKRYYDRNVRDAEEFAVKLHYLHRNPVKRGLVNDPAEWKWSSFRHYAFREIGAVEVESEWTARDRENTEGIVRRFLVPG